MKATRRSFMGWLASAALAPTILLRSPARVPSSAIVTRHDDLAELPNDEDPNAIMMHQMARALARKVDEDLIRALVAAG